MAKKEKHEANPLARRTAPKSKEKYLIDNAKRLYDNPYLILPTGADAQSEKYFKKLHKRIEKVHRFRDNQEKLEKLANKKGLEGALAGTLTLVHSEKAPILGVVSYTTGDVTFAHRGKADKEKLIAVQHFDDPVLRLLGIKDIAYSKKLSVYSWDNGFVCTGKTSNPPKEFVDFISTTLGVTCASNICSRPHSHPNKDSEKKERHLRITWKSADTYMILCENCTKNTQNTVFNISKYLIEPKLSNTFDIAVIADVFTQNSETSQNKTEYIDEYLSGSLTDYELIQKNIKKREDDVKQCKDKIYVLNNISYGCDLNKFLDVLKPTPHERTALDFILEKTQEPLIVNQTTPNKILERYWKDYGLAFIETIITDKKTAESFFQLDETPSQIITLVFEYQQRQTILAQLPQFTSLSTLGQYIDTVTRTYKTFGEKKALTEIKKMPDNPKGKSLSYAFLLTLGKATETKWKYSKEEIEYGTFLKPYTEKLLAADPQNYTALLQELLTASGSTETIR
jgi:hypothetical protein